MRYASNFVNESVSADNSIAYMQGNIPIRIASIGIILQHKAYELSQSSVYTTLVHKVTVNAPITVFANKIQSFDYNGAPIVIGGNMSIEQPITITAGDYTVLHAAPNSDATTSAASIIMLVDGEWIAFTGASITEFMKTAVFAGVLYDPKLAMPSKKMTSRLPALTYDRVLQIVKAMRSAAGSDSKAGIAIPTSNVILQAYPSSNPFNAVAKPDLAEFAVSDTTIVSLDLTTASIVLYFYAGDSATPANLIVYYSRNWYLIIPSSVAVFFKSTIDQNAINIDRSKVTKLTDTEISTIIDEFVKYSMTLTNDVSVEIGHAIVTTCPVPASAVKSVADSIGGKQTLVQMFDNLVVPYIVTNSKVVFAYNNMYWSTSYGEFASCIAQSSIFKKVVKVEPYVNEAISEIILSDDPTKVAAMMETEGVEYDNKLIRVDKTELLAGFVTYKDSTNDTVYLYNKDTKEFRVRGNLMAGIEFRYNVPIESTNDIKVALSDLKNPQSTKWTAWEIGDVMIVESRIHDTSMYTEQLFTIDEVNKMHLTAEQKSIVIATLKTLEPVYDKYVDTVNDIDALIVKRDANRGSDWDKYQPQIMKLAKIRDSHDADKNKIIESLRKQLKMTNVAQLLFKVKHK